MEPYVENVFGTQEVGGVKIGRLRINMIKTVSTFVKHGCYEYNTGAQVHRTNELWHCKDAGSLVDLITTFF